MIRQEKLEYLAFGRPEYLLNLLSKHNLKITSVRVKEDGIKFKITATDKLKLEQIFKNYGKKYELVKRNGWAINAGKIGKNLAFWIGALTSLIMVLAYSFSITEVNVIGAKRLDASAIKTAVLDEVKLPAWHQESVLDKVEKIVKQMDGVAYVSSWKSGRTLNIEVVEELPKVEKIDTQNFVSIKAKEDGVVTKIVVFGGTAIVKVGDEVKRGQELILPYLENASGERKNTLAIGNVYAKITRENTFNYASESEYKERFLSEYENGVNEFKASLSPEDEYLGSHFFVKNVDKTIVCSIYYEYVTRIT